MRHRPKRENYPGGVYGEIDYQERLERYCTYLENKNKALTEQCNIANVVWRSEQLAAIFEKMNRQHITMLEIGDYDKLAKEILSS